jgi:multiple sugar transport system substrate-binding protein
LYVNLQRYKVCFSPQSLSLAPVVAGAVHLPAATSKGVTVKQVDTGPRHLSRRQLLLGGGALVGSLSLGASLTGCGGSAQAAGNDIRFWHLLSGGDGIKMMAMIDKANADHTDFRIMPTVLAWGAPYYT